MNLSQLQAKCDQLVEQFNGEFVVLRRDLADAVQAVADLWEPVVTEHGGTVSDLHGMIHCTDVRGMLLLRTVGFRNPDSPPKPGVFAMRYGQGMSAQHCSRTSEGPASGSGRCRRRSSRSRASV